MCVPKKTLCLNAIEKSDMVFLNLLERNPLLNIIPDIPRSKVSNEKMIMLAVKKTILGLKRNVYLRSEVMDQIMSSATQS